MRNIAAGAVGGIVAGALISGVMLGGRRAGLLHKTLGEQSEDWLDRNFGSRGHVGETGTFLVEQANHLAASAGFGAALGAVHSQWKDRPELTGALYGTAIYAVAIGLIAPALGITEGERRARPAERMERLGLHVLFGLVTAMTTDALSDGRGGED